jgi:hypothetical protein
MKIKTLKHHMQQILMLITTRQPDMPPADLYKRDVTIVQYSKACHTFCKHGCLERSSYCFQRDAKFWDTQKTPSVEDLRMFTPNSTQFNTNPQKSLWPLQTEMLNLELYVRDTSLWSLFTKQQMYNTHCFVLLQWTIPALMYIQNRCYRRNQAMLNYKYLFL